VKRERQKKKKLSVIIVSRYFAFKINVNKPYQLVLKKLFVHERNEEDVLSQTGSLHLTTVTTYCDGYKVS
jgi:hypothetical protein